MAGITNKGIYFNKNSINPSGLDVLNTDRVILYSKNDGSIWTLSSSAGLVIDTRVDNSDLASITGQLQDQIDNLNLNDITQNNELDSINNNISYLSSITGGFATTISLSASLNDYTTLITTSNLTASLQTQLSSIISATGNYATNSTVYNISAGLVSLTSSSSANAYIQSQIYTNTISGYLSNNIAGLSQSLSGYITPSYLNPLTGSLQTQLTSNQTTLSRLTSTSGSYISYSNSTSANSLVQANNNTNSLLTSYITTVNAAAMSANSLVQSQVYTNAISGYLSNNIAGISQSLSGYTTPSYINPLTGFLQTQLTSNQTTLSRLTSTSGSYISYSNSTSANAFTQAQVYTNTSSGNIIQYINSNSASLTLVTAASANAYNQAINAVALYDAAQDAAMSGSLISYSNSTSSNSFIQSQVYANTVSGNIIQYINSGVITSSTNISGGMYQGIISCDTTNITYTVSHPTIDINSVYPTIALIIPTSGSNIFLQGIYNRTISSFQVALSEVPNISGYQISWHLPTSSLNLLSYTPLTTTGILTGALQDQLNSNQTTLSLLSSVSGGSYIAYSNSASANAYVQALNAASIFDLAQDAAMSGALVTLTYNTSANAYVQALNAASIFDLAQDAAMSGALVTLTYNTSANAYVQALNAASTFDLAQDASMSGALVTLSYNTSANAFIQSKINTYATSANSLVQANNNTNSISGYLSNNIAGLSQSLSGYITPSYLNPLTGSLQTQLTSNQTTLSRLTSTSGSYISYSNSTSANSLVQANNNTNSLLTSYITTVNAAAMSANAYTQTNAMSANAYIQAKNLSGPAATWNPLTSNQLYSSQTVYISASTLRTYVGCNVTGGPITVVLPNNPPIFQEVLVKHEYGNVTSNNITITGGTSNIDNFPVHIIDQDDGGFIYIFANNQWRIF